MRQYFNKIYKQFKSGTQRFSIPCFLSVLFFIIFSIIILYPKQRHDFMLSDISNAILVGIAFGIFWKLLVERKHWETRLYGKYLFFANIPIMLLAYGIVKYIRPIEYAYLMESGLICAFLCFSYWLLSKHDSDNNLFSTLFGSGIFSWWLVLLSAAGILLCLTAINILLTHVPGDYYTIGIVFAVSIVGLFTFLGRIPVLGVVLPAPGYCKSIIMKLLVTVYIVLVAILYGYLVKIALARSFPQGAMNWYASLATMFYIFFSWCLRGIEEDHFYQKFIKINGLVLIPIILVQCWCIWIRFTAYGLTTLRYASMLCVIFGILGIIGNYVKWSVRRFFAIAGICFLLFSFTPLNIIDVPNYQQESRMKAVLMRNKMYADGKVIIPVAPVSNQDIGIIHDSFDYLHKYHGGSFFVVTVNAAQRNKEKEQEKAPFMAAVTTPEAKRIFSSLKQTESKNNKIETIRFLATRQEKTVVTGYSTITVFNPTNGFVRINSASDAKDIPIMTFAEDVWKKYHAGFYDNKAQKYKADINNITISTALIYDYSPNIRLVFRDMLIKQNSDGKLEAHGSGYVLEK